MFIRENDRPSSQFNPWMSIQNFQCVILKIENFVIIFLDYP